MSRMPVPSRRAIGATLRQRREARGWSRQDVEARSAARGARLDAETLARIEGGTHDPGVRRLFLLLDLYEVPMLEDLVQLCEMGSTVPAGDLAELRERAKELWRSGESARALAYYLALRERAPNDEAGRAQRQEALIAFASYARDAHRFRLTQQILEPLFVEETDPFTAVSTSLIVASAWRRTSAYTIARVFAEQAVRQAAELDERWRALAAHAVAAIAVDVGDLALATSWIEQALPLYERAGDMSGHTRCETLRMRLLEQLGRLDEAIDCARATLATAAARGYRWLEIGLRGELGRMLVARGQHAAGLVEIERSLHDAQLKDYGGLVFSAHVQLWRTHAALGNAREADEALARAEQALRGLDLRTAEADEVRRAAAERAALMTSEDDDGVM